MTGHVGRTLTTALVREAGSADVRAEEDDVTDDPTVEVERLRRQLRAMSAVNRQLQSELDVREPVHRAGRAGS